MASPISAQQPTQQQRSAQESREEFQTRMVNMVSMLSTDTIFFYKHVSKSMATEVVQGRYASALFCFHIDGPIDLHKTQDGLLVQEVPKDFLHKHSKKFGKNVTLVTPEILQSWPIKITVRSFRDSKARVFAYGHGGWTAFLIDNRIKVGDVLFFILTKFSHFEVLIGRSPEEICLHDNKNLGANQASLQETSSNTLAMYPRFVVTICRPLKPQHPENHFYLENDLSLVVPSSFWELHSHMLEGDELQLKGPLKAITMVKVAKTFNEEVQLVCLEHFGWKAFLLANNLGVGDILEFSLIANSSFNVKVVEPIEIH